MSIDVGVAALRGRFDLFSQASTSGAHAGHFLLRFYAVECGLKAAVLRRRRARSTAQLPESLRSHDLRALAIELRLPPLITQALKPCASHESGQQIHVHQVHEAWRYGRRLSASTEKDFVAGLDLLIAWCREELR
ncbi:hypothetical protein [Catenuloplanes nepalensis]|uniref:hypothetical protein n=1 Tax=Catenuloplanes nepalensis TaxID=587533 RepID=UPI0027D86BBC|nr:hypothetical protein [Catenuloplanes nepalensis]